MSNNHLEGCINDGKNGLCSCDTEYKPEKPVCFGKYLHQECADNGGHHACQVYGYRAETEENSCRLFTNLTLGVCDCEYKKHCHEMRQKYAYRPKERCDVYRMMRVDDGFEPPRPWPEVKRIGRVRYFIERLFGRDRFGGI